MLFTPRYVGADLALCVIESNYFDGYSTVSVEVSVGSDKTEGFPRALLRHRDYDIRVLVACQRCSIVSFNKECVGASGASFSLNCLL